MKKKREAGEYSRFTKKERLLIDREIERLKRFYAGIAGLVREPEVLFVIDVKREASAVREAKKMGLTVIAVVDSNADPTGIDYIIPMNDDSTKALSYVLDLVDGALSGSTPKAKVAEKLAN
jgi:small subunit ribosomal protein S2